MFDRLHQHLTRLADEVEQAMKTDKSASDRRANPASAGSDFRGGIAQGPRPPKGRSRFRFGLAAFLNLTRRYSSDHDGRSVSGALLAFRPRGIA
jgi:hypothetical protein